MNSDARAAFAADVARSLPHWVEKVRVSKGSRTTPFLVRRSRARKSAETAIRAALDAIDSAGTLTPMGMAAAAQGVPLSDVAQHLRRILDGLRDQGAVERQRGRPSPLARAEALHDLANLWRLHGLGKGDPTDAAFMNEAVTMYRQHFGFSRSRNSDLRSSVEGDFTAWSAIQSAIGCK